MKHAKVTIHKTSKRSWIFRTAFLVVLLAASAYLLATHWHTVQQSFSAAQEARWGWLMAAGVLMALTYFIAGAVYRTLAFKPLLYRQLLLVEVATSFVNRLLPSGVGGMGLNGVYLYKRRHTVAEATAVVAANNLTGIAAHLSLLLAVLVLNPGVLNNLSIGYLALPWQVVAVVFLVLFAALALPRVRAKIASFGHSLLRSLKKFTFSKIAVAYLLGVFITLTYTTILFCSAQAIGIELNVLQILLIFSVGILASSATPTPGGLVGAEAGLFAGFVAYGASPASAGAAVLLYRVVTYWLPILPGAVTLYLARRQRIV